MKHLLMVFLCVGIGIIIYRIIEQTSLYRKKNLQILIQLPPEYNTLPSQKFFDTVHSAKRAFFSSPHPTKIHIVSPSKETALYAKIVLHSYGVGNQAMAVSDALEALHLDDGSFLRVFGVLRREEESHLKRKNIAFLKQDVRAKRRLAVPSKEVSRDAAIIVLGNRPLDHSTPTVDMVKRTLRGIEWLKTHPDAWLVLTGGMTFGEISEAKMMTLIARSRGVPESQMILEEEARTTGGNAEFTERKLSSFDLQNIFLVSKASHLSWAVPVFQQRKLFQDIEGLVAQVSREEVIHQMQEYLKFQDSHQVRRRLNNLVEGVHGVDE